MDQKNVSQNQTKYIQFRLSEEQYNKLKISGEHMDYLRIFMRKN
ncbi:hypothetical protein ICE98_00181 [Lactococcus lactis]|nr:hypothetical protein [Lactococcus lactis]